MVFSRATLLRSVGLVALALFVAFFPEFRREAETVWQVITQPSVEGVSEPGTVVVERIVDGDTFVIAGGERVRLIGIDTPESVQPGAPIECFGREASAFLKMFLEGKTVRLERDVSDRDRYGRLLRYTYLGDEFVNEVIVRQGYATAVSYPPDVRELDRLRVAERLAREERSGLWDPKRCPNL